MGQNEEMSKNACRLCDGSGASMHSVFERVSEGIQLLQLIKDYLRVLIYRTDPLSKQICENCYNNLVNFNTLKKMSLETFNRQTERLKQCNSENNISIRLFLNMLEQESSPVEGEYSNGQISEEKVSDSSESELCAQLQKAIQDSLRSSKLQENNCMETNGHVMEDDDSQASKDLQGSESPFSQNADSQSDMELCDSDQEYTPKIITTNIRGKRLLNKDGDTIQGPPLKKRRFVGPKSRIDQRRDYYITKLLGDKCKKEKVTYNPLSLMLCALNSINKTNGFECGSYWEVEKEFVLDRDLGSFMLGEENICNYCDEVFINGNELAVHETRHIYVVLGDKVDKPCDWTPEENANALTRNNWFNSIKVDERKRQEGHVEVFKDSTGQVNVLNPDDVKFKDVEEATDDQQELLVVKSPSAAIGEVVLIDTQATVNGIPLAEISKDDRRNLYKAVTVNGAKRKFCQLCRYTFKDNWAIECHYFSTACHYTCRFCGVRFNKQRNEFDNHIKRHIMSGDVHTNKIFASRKFQSVPRVIPHNKVKARVVPQDEVVRKVAPSRMKRIYAKPRLVEVKKEVKKEPQSHSPLPGQEGIRTDGKQNQAYFCRKCYQVFFKLDEFNVHVVSCKGSGFSKSAIYANAAKPTTRTKTLETEKFSPTGRPMRNCVKEVSTYADDMQEELDPPSQIKQPRVSVVKSSRGFECGLCSSCFPTVHSRNSHMRIHKGALHELSAKSVKIAKNRSGKGNVAKKVAGRLGSIPTFAKYVNNVKIKQEPMEPIVEIHEHNSGSFPSSIGSVSITPIPNTSQKTTLDPNIMKLVKNNPNLTIKTMGDNSNRNATPTGSPHTPDGDSKCYRCLSCSKPFANKSNLYFHKKNQCSGSKYPCPFCKKRFGTEASYSSHIFYNHPE